MNHCPAPINLNPPPVCPPPVNPPPVNPHPISSFPHDPGNSSSDALDINLTSQIKSYTDSVGANDPDDYYRFTLQLDTDINLSLGNTSGVNLQLLNQAGAVLQNGTALTGSLDLGTYYLRVHASTANETPYTLNLSANPRPITIITPRGDTEIVNVTTSDSDVPMYLALANSSYAASQTKLDSFRQDPGFLGLDGRGYSVAVLDTGINLNHPFFGSDQNGDGIADRIVYQYDFADNDNDASDKDGHGSNVSSIIASQNETYRGVAPGVNIISLKVFKDSGSSAGIEQALQWVLANAEKYNIVSVNMSLGDGTNGNEPNGLKIVDNGKGLEVVDPAGYSDELAALAKKGVIVVAADGNDYFKYQTQGVTYPAADPNALAVGAVYDGNNGGFNFVSGAKDNTTGTDRITSFSQRSTTLTDILLLEQSSTGWVE